MLRPAGLGGNHIHYGYRKSPDDKNLWLVDEESAAVVRRIVQMTINGMGPYQISRTLTDGKILRPAAYIALRDGRDILDPDDK